MVKINLKSASPIETEYEPVKTEKKEGKPAGQKFQESREELDLSFDSTESFFEKAEPVTEPKKEEQEERFVPEPESSEPLQRKRTVEYSFEEEDGFQSTVSRNKPFFIIGGVLLGLLIIVVLYFTLTGGDEDTFADQPAEPEKVTGEAAPSTESKLPPAVLSQYQQNTASNRFIKNQLQGFINNKPASADYSLIVLTPTDINLTALADSRDQIAKFHIDLKQAFPNIGFRVISVQSKFEDSGEKFYADVTANINPPRSASLSTQEINTAPPGNVKTAIQNIANRNNVKLQYFKEGKNSSHAAFGETLYYANLTGTKQNITKFLSDVVDAYPMVKINKFTIYPYNLSTISDSNLSTRMSFTFYRAK